MVQVRLQGLDVKVRELEARLVEVAQAASEATSGADRANGQTLQLEAQLADIAGALLMLADQLAVAGTTGTTEPLPAMKQASVEDASSLVARKVLQLLNDAT